MRQLRSVEQKGLHRSWQPLELELASDVCLALGNESNGLRADDLDRCDAVGYLPLLGRVGSLNVAAAAAAALFEIRRQGWQAR